MNAHIPENVTPKVEEIIQNNELMESIFANLGEETIKWSAGDRIAQLVICPVKRVIFNNIAEFSPDKFENTRNENGFGSTGKSN